MTLHLKNILEKVYLNGLSSEIFPRHLPKSAPTPLPAAANSSDMPGIYLDYRSLSNDLKVDQRTILNYISYLDYSLLITKFYNFSKSRFTSEKKLKRIYLSNAGFILTLRLCEPEYRYLLEGYFANLFYFLFL